MCKSGRFEKMEALSIVKTASSYSGSHNKGRFYCSKASQPPFLIKALKGLHIYMLWCVNSLYLPKGLESVQQITSSGSHDMAAM